MWASIVWCYTRVAFGRLESFGDDCTDPRGRHRSGSLLPPRDRAQALLGPAHVLVNKAGSTPPRLERYAPLEDIHPSTT